MSRAFDLTRFWAAATGLALIALMLIQAVAGRPAWDTLPMLLAAILGFEVGMTGYDFWRVRRHG